ncbi:MULTISPECIES: TetR/AcrR family transcriptional regulator [Variovorax]|jgi:TetR/AcrR family transcriptional regulator|uniref:TetR/AcrR family transcriptional regulator n=1 Tax=Variovorax ginsengisoli TaxID=363844 RepID=A0ABT8S930_9BURK|nr:MULTISPECIES: TetR/AcrR family transcriptional regulator [Variovorax]HET7834475.1 TetR/AcrR family transcriptional regulator [Variovorax sp.]MDM0068296.1 TetR/AcrR family transcriptional regulator [Variovorax sp. J31P207]MDM0083965.1 TetR/AcrR family transcriptional regulator [Variovorax sp. J31P179]MDN8615567.1 TetR/AcrR family transcriptional regulator [Variovorax ginsengisoli]MDO1534737.1 TetR/AcrR family transcriptional regulator [Variovorax ginsengisoli]
MPASRFLKDKLCPVSAKRERRKEARPGELLEAALDLFVEKGFAATRSEEVAARAGVSKGTLFLYFQSKEELFKAVVIENLAGRFTEWNREFDEYEGSTADMLRYCMRVWWERVGATKASGLTKLMMSEGRNFPELAEFYRREVVKPGHELLRRIVQRGIDRGEFAPVEVDLAIYTVIAPMIFLMLTKHSPAICFDHTSTIDPEKYLALQAETVLHGLCRTPKAAE